LSIFWITGLSGAGFSRHHLVVVVVSNLNIGPRLAITHLREVV